MARIHSKKHGKSKSLKPILEKGEIPEGVKMNKEEIIKKIVDYANHGIPPALIGEKLKGEGVPYVKQITGERVVQILKDNSINPEIPYDLLDLMKKAVKINHHLQSNRSDQFGKTNLNRVESKIWRLTKYYINEGVLPKGWRYNAQRAELLIKKV